MGMRILGFEGSWLHHPFWRANFTIEDAETLRKVRESKVTGVVIDVPADIQPAPAPAVAKPAPAPRRQPPAAIRNRPAPEPTERSTSNGGSADLERARTVIRRARQVMFRVFEQARLGRAVKAAELTSLVDEISDSVMNNPGAMLNVARLKDKNEYTYMHSVAVCTLMVNLARTLNLPEEDHRAIGMAGLLHDIGKITIPLEILDKPGALTAEEYELVKQHALNGRELIADSSDLTDIALDVCAHHHERIDGTGYPFGLAGERLTLYARMGAICDVYDALTSNRAYKEGWAPQEALKAMQSWEGHFDKEIFFQFMRSVGIFPAGMLVELRSRRLAVILPNGRRNSRPRARVFFDMREREFLPLEDVQLDDSLKHDQALREGDPARWRLADWDNLRDAILDNIDPRTQVNRAA